MTPILELRSLTKTYGSLAAVSDVSIAVDAGERRALIGPNGAGKSTLLSLISGRLQPSDGQVMFLGKDVTRSSEDARARAGMAKTFQHSRLFDGLSSHENVRLAAQRAAGISWDLFRPARRYPALADRADALLEMVGLAGSGSRLAGELSHGERRQLELGLALANDPQLLLLDEPVAGMSAGETERFLELVRKLPEKIAVVIVEHDMDVVFSLATRVTVLQAGRLLKEGSPHEVANAEEVQDAYFGHALADELRLK